MWTSLLKTKLENHPRGFKMKPTLPRFYTSFYGPEFSRWFRRPQKFNDERPFKIQYFVKTPRGIIYLVKHNTGHYPCLISIYSYGVSCNLYTDNIKDNVIVDRLFMDFDLDLSADVKETRRKLKNLRKTGLSYHKDEQFILKKEFQDYVIDSRIAEPAILEAKDFAAKFLREYGKEPALFFSGSKGCHAYLFFEPVDLININRTISYFTERIKENYDYKTPDLSVSEDADVRMSRIPYSQHELTGLAVVPFKSTDTYEEIIKKSRNPKIEYFDINEYITNFGEHLKNIDSILEKKQIKESIQEESVVEMYSGNYIDFNYLDHRDFFSKILGKPAKEYPNKKYVMYSCPFKDHDDTNPSFRVHKTGYKCYGCGRKGNYWHFLKDYYGWDDKQVKMFLKTHKLKKL